MPLIEHLRELRVRFIWSMAAVAIGMMVLFVPPIGLHVVALLLRPAQQALPGFKPQYIEPMENIVVYFQVALLGGVVIGMPMIIYQVLAFVGPALEPQERRWVFPIVIVASLAFAGGVAFGFFVTLPAALRFLLTFGSSVAQANIRIGTYIDFVLRILFIAGLVFETPLVIMGLSRLRIIGWRKLLSWWRFAVVLSFVVSAVVTPTIDPVTQSLVALPIASLYFIGIGLAWLVRPRAT